MKHLYKSICALLTVAACGGFAGCDDELDRPPVIVPEATYQINMTVDQFKTEFWQYAQNNTFTTIPMHPETGDSIVLGGRIITTDADGNIYQQLIIEDETGALNFCVNMYDINESYQYGQEVRINVTGMLVGGYGRLMQVGGLYNGSLGRMEKAVFTTHAQVNGLPRPEEVIPLKTDIGTLNKVKTDQEALRYFQSRLIMLEAVHFTEGGKALFSDNPGQTGATNRTLADAEGNTIVVRTSNKATFASEVLPKGTGNFTAILSYFNNDWQLTLMDPQSGCTGGFELNPELEKPVTPPTTGAIFEETFKSGMGDFTIVNVTAPKGVDAVWKHDSKYGYAIATGYLSGTNSANDSWLVSPAIDLTGATDPVLTFEYVINFFTDLAAAKKEISVGVREQGEAWTPVEINAWPPEMGWNNWATPEMSLAAFKGKKVEIGFHYTSTDTKAGTWELKNVKVFNK